MDKYQDVLLYLEELKEDSDLSRKFREKAEQIIALLTSNVDLATEKALAILEEMNSTDVSPYHRTQVWDVISMLESTKSL